MVLPVSPIYFHYDINRGSNTKYNQPINTVLNQPIKAVQNQPITDQTNQPIRRSLRLRNQARIKAHTTGRRLEAPS